MSSDSEKYSIQIQNNLACDENVNGKKLQLFLLRNKYNFQVAITNYGARVVSILVANNQGGFTDIALGYDNIKTYLKSNEPFFGATIGRYSNRLAKGKFILEGKEYQIDINNGPNSLHGGKEGFSNQVWDATQINKQSIELSYLSKDNEGGYPGNLNVKIAYTLTDDNALKIKYTATTDKNTVINLTNHTYFNLNGEGNGSINDHLLTINANSITEINEKLIPTGKLIPVIGTPFDFTKPTEIGSRLNSLHEQLIKGNGYDHNFVLNEGNTLRFAAKVVGPKTGIILEVFTEEPGMQFYGGNYLNGSDKDGKCGKSYDYRTGFCLETQHFPDSPNHSHFPTTILKPGQVFKSTTIYKFSVE